MGAGEKGASCAGVKQVQRGRQGKSVQSRKGQQREKGRLGERACAGILTRLYRTWRWGRVAAVGRVAEGGVDSRDGREGELGACRRHGKSSRACRKQHRRDDRVCDQRGSSRSRGGWGGGPGRGQAAGTGIDGWHAWQGCVRTTVAFGHAAQHNTARHCAAACEPGPKLK